MTATTTAAPDRSLAQRMDALHRANEVRVRRARLKRDVKAGREPVGRLVLAPPDWLGAMTVLDLLLAVPCFGRVKANRVLVRARVAPSKTLRGLSDRQRIEVVRLLGGRA